MQSIIATFVGAVAVSNTAVLRARATDHFRVDAFRHIHPPQPGRVCIKRDATSACPVRDTTRFPLHGSVLERITRSSLRELRRTAGLGDERGIRLLRTLWSQPSALLPGFFQSACARGVFVSRAAIGP
jgi:hypothetical protein